MPELPEVTTTVNGLKRVLKNLTITGVWTDLAKKNPIKQFKNTVKDEVFFKKFKKAIVGQKVESVERRAKNILINLSPRHGLGQAGGNTILIHLKMTGHLIFGKYVFSKKENKWTPDKNERRELHDPYNRFIHVVFVFLLPLSRGRLGGGTPKEMHLVFCDTRKFGKVTLLKTEVMHDSIHLKNIGPEPLDKNFNFIKFKEQLLKKPASRKTAIKTVLMNQEVIAGIGNIYSDEMLWLAKIHPESKPQNIPDKNLKLLYKSMLKVLNQGIDFGGDSMSDYRDIDGKRGNFQNHHNVYRKNKEKCRMFGVSPKGDVNGCIGVIMRKVINGRSAHFCDKHQITY